MRHIFALIGGLIVIVLAVFALNCLALGNYQFFAPKYEQARRQVFEETKSYRDGLRRDFENLYMEYLKAKTPEEKQAVLSIIRHRADGVDPEFVPFEIRSLLKGV